LRVEDFGFWFLVLGVRIWGVGFRFRGFKVWGFRFKDQGLRLRVWDLGSRVSGLGCRV
jgi:hypothetical protein